MKMGMWLGAIVALAMTPGIEAVAAEAAPEAVSCAKCETVWVRSPLVGQKARGYTRVGKMTCPDCVTAVENVFKGGKLEHACKTCGDLVACRAEQLSLNESENTERAATCSKCVTTWVRKSQPIGKIKAYRTQKSMTCADCEAAARTYTETGVWKSACGHCGDALTACQ